MARSARIDFSELLALEQRFKDLNKAETERFNEELVKEVAKGFLNRVIKLTPVGVYTDGKVGGTLRRGWTVKSQREAELSSTFGRGTSVNKHVENLIVKKQGKTYSIDVINPVEYASYVNYGHRTTNGGWVNGKFFNEKALESIGKSTRKTLDRKLHKLLREALDGD